MELNSNSMKTEGYRPPGEDLGEDDEDDGIFIRDCLLQILPLFMQAQESKVQPALLFSCLFIAGLDCDSWLL